MFQQIVFLLTISIVCGCAHVPKDNFEARGDVPYSECKKTPAKVAFVTEGLDFTLDRLRYRDLSDPNNADSFLAKTVLAEIHKSESVELVKEVKPKYIIGFTLHNDNHNYLLSWVTIFTLGIVPIKQGSEMWINVRVFDSNEQLIYETNSFKLEYDRYTGWLIAPFISKDKAMSSTELNEKFIPLMIKDLVGAMTRKNILDCKN